MPESWIIPFDGSAFIEGEDVVFAPVIEVAANNIWGFCVDYITIENPPDKIEVLSDLGYLREDPIEKYRVDG